VSEKRWLADPPEDLRRAAEELRDTRRQVAALKEAERKLIERIRTDLALLEADGIEDVVEVRVVEQRRLDTTIVRTRFPEIARACTFPVTVTQVVTG
jgi:hypothetical protein